MRKRIVVASALGIGGGLAYLLTKKKGGQRESSVDVDAGNETRDKAASMKSAEDEFSAMPNEMTAESTENRNDVVIDDQGTNQTEATNILRSIRDEAFEGSDEKLALALGRPEEEIQSWTSGAGIIDGDVILKARTLASQRGIDLQRH
jgi:hypothetical protein